METAGMRTAHCGTFSLPDCTVGPGFAPDLLALAGLASTARPYRRSGIGLTCRPHPAPKAPGYSTGA